MEDTKVPKEILALLERCEAADRASRIMIEIGELATAHSIACRAAHLRAQLLDVLRRRANIEPPGEEIPHRETSTEPPPPESDSDWLERALGHLWVLFSDPSHRREFLSRRWKLLSALALGLLLALAAKPLYESLFLANRGLSGAYFSNRDLVGASVQRRDLRIDFRWTRRPPLQGIPAEDFSIRWTGRLRTPISGTYEFATLSDDGVRLWIGDHLIIDNWTVHGSTLDVGNIELMAGFHPIRLEYFQATGDTVLKLFWRRPDSTRRQLIAPRYLHPDEAAAR